MAGKKGDLISPEMKKKMEEYEKKERERLKQATKAKKEIVIPPTKKDKTKVP